MTVIIDYGAGNLFSVQNALYHLGIENKISSKRDDIEAADRLILPGVGAFPDAMRKLKEAGLVDVIKRQAQLKPLMGICLGMQMLLDKSYEFGETDGLGLIPGTVELMTPAGGLPIPHIGWNEYIAAYCGYGMKVPALVQNGNVYGCQFHPEKSGETGLEILRRFASL